MEDGKIIESILNRTFFKAWKHQHYLTDEKYNLFKELEVMISAYCDQKCEYCYYKRYGLEYTYKKEIAKPKLVLKNLDMILEWLERNEYYPVFNLFSGEIFAQPAGFEAVDKVIDFHKRNGIKARTTIPTNMSFLFDDEKTKRVEELLQKGKEDGLGIHLSASVDGKYCDSNRPFRDGRVKTDEWYEKFFDFTKKHNCGFHPMVYSKKIEDWQKNFDWFQENFAKRNMHWLSIYLLEVRNEEWTKTELNEYYKFTRYCVNYAYKKAIENEGIEPKDFPRFASKNKAFNFMTLFGKVGRGTTCSIQTTAQVRLGDLTHVLCHRAAYKPHELWKFKVENDKIVGIDPINVSSFISWISADKSVFPMCETCLINHFCIGQCWGSTFETNRDHFVPIPSVCALEHIKVKAVLDEVYDLGLHQYFYDYTNPEQMETMKTYYRINKGVLI